VVFFVKYLYGDSTEFPLHQDFLSTLRSFVSLSEQALPLERSILDAEKTVEKLESDKQMRLQDIEAFKERILHFLEDALASSESRDVLEGYAVEIKDFVNRTLEVGMKKYVYTATYEIKRQRDEIFESEERMRSLFEDFLKNDPIVLREHCIELSRVGEHYRATLRAFCDHGISYQFELDTGSAGFWSVLRRTVEFKRDVSVPIGMKKPLLKKELVPNYVNLNDYVLTDLRIHLQRVEMILKRQISAEKEYFKMSLNCEEKRFSAQIAYVDREGREHNLLEVEELKAAVDMKSLEALGGRVLAKAEELMERKGRLLSLNLEGEEVIERRLVQKLLVVMAQTYQPLISEIRKRSLSESELILKVQDESGERREMYLNRSELAESLSSLGAGGGEVLRALGIV
jgi:hypothetical protein